MYNLDLVRAREGRAPDDGSGGAMVEDRTAVVGEVGRDSVAFALTDADGLFREDTIQRFDADSHTTISSALLAFKEQAGLTSLPRRCALAVAGVPRGDTISITNSRWFISRSGLGAILQRPPLVINDFAANVWAVSATDPRNIQAAGAAAPESGPGTFVVVGMGGGLGVAAFIRDESGQVIVVPTEAGHSELIDCAPEIVPLIEVIKRNKRHCSAETLLSSGGLAALRNAIGELQGVTVAMQSGEEVIRAAATGDADSRKAVALFAKALWRFAGNLTLIFGAWDGVFMTGRMVNALRSTLRQPEIRQGFVVPGPYANSLRNVPGGFLLLEHSELRGAAEAIRRQP